MGSDGVAKKNQVERSTCRLTPIFDLQALDSVEMLPIMRYDNKLIRQSSACDQEIEIIECLSLLAKLCIEPSRNPYRIFRQRTNDAIPAEIPESPHLLVCVSMLETAQDFIQRDDTQIESILRFEIGRHPGLHIVMAAQKHEYDIRVNQCRLHAAAFLLPPAVGAPRSLGRASRTPPRACRPSCPPG